MQSSKLQAVRKLDIQEARPSDREALHEALLREIADDARIAPERYLQDSIVPEGGE
ncbi:hypothetical protein [Chondromyces crocatus]|uniref:Uncharacterized protein n=1 Tax=Chondromyces crocatus TaxID=52 RepID=A0A0K1ESC8_CHOCO|nr:hypothetical protein [Chondromyces crocatus]AKT43694.1 uncharacterized protein CMC5_079290 [Chondromyces crocatus]